MATSFALQSYTGIHTKGYRLNICLVATLFSLHNLLLNLLYILLSHNTKISAFLGHSLYRYHTNSSMECYDN